MSPIDRECLRIMSAFALLAFVGCSPPEPMNGPGSTSPFDSQPAKEAPPADKPPHSSSMFGNTYTFLAIADPPGDREAVLAALKKDFATDQEALALLRRLHGNLPVKLDVLETSTKNLRERTPEENEAELDRWIIVPTPGIPVQMRISFERSEKLHFESNGKESKQSKELAGVGLGGVLEIRFATEPADKPGTRPSGNPVLLAVNDHLLRKGHGWLLFDSSKATMFPAELHAKLGKDRKGYQSYLDDRTAAYTKEFKTYWSEQGVEFK